MPGKKYRPASQESSGGASLVRDAKPRPYGRGQNRKRGGQFVLSVGKVKARFKKPVKRSKGEIAPRDISANAPFWLRRLDLVKAEMKTIRFPRTAQEGLRQCAELSATARRWFRQSIQADHPGASEEEIEQERRLLLARLSAAQERWTVKWKKERGRYFGR